MTVVADLHVHTKASDGLLTPAGVVELAKGKNLCAIGITDHDTVDGVEEALQAGSLTSLRVFAGVELSAEWKNMEIHILGYCIDFADKHLRMLLSRLRQSRFGRAEKMVNQLRSLGYNIHLDEVMNHAGDAAPGRPHVARALVDKGYISSVSDAFTHLLSRGKPGYVKRFKITPQEAIKAIIRGGGFSVWAHPGLTGDDRLIGLFKSCGLAGLEAFHPDHSFEMTCRYLQLAKENNLVVSGGSDFHGVEAGRVRRLGYCGLTEEGLLLFENVCRNHTL